MAHRVHLAVSVADRAMRIVPFLVMGVVVSATMSCSSDLSLPPCETAALEGRPTFGADRAIICVLAEDTPVSSVLDTAVFDALPAETLADRLKRLPSTSTVRAQGEIRWAVVDGSRAALEAACVQVRSGPEGECVWQLNAALSKAGPAVLRGGLERALRDYPTGSYVLTIEQRPTGVRGPWYAIRFSDGRITSVEWRDAAVPPTLRLPGRR